MAIAVPDVNILVNAFRQEMPEHQNCLSWLQAAAGTPDGLGMTSEVLSGFIRIVTNAGIFKPPSPTSEAIGFCRQLLESPGCRRLVPGERHWVHFTDLCQRANVSGSRIPDAWLAAIALEHKGHIVSLDRDFARFPGVVVMSPRAPSMP